MSSNTIRLGKPRHLAPHSDRSVTTACGITSTTAHKSTDPFEVDCVRCRSSRAYRDLRRDAREAAAVYTRVDTFATNELRGLSDDELMRRRKVAEQQIANAYWAFTRQSRANPPPLVCPDAYKQRTAISIEQQRRRRANDGSG